MRLIGLAVVLTFSLFTAPLAADGQQPVKVPRLGYLGIDPPTVGSLGEGVAGAWRLPRA
jgi:hypothetical protein